MAVQLFEDRVSISHAGVLSSDCGCKACKLELNTKVTK